MLADELSEALLYVQRKNNERLNDMVAQYRPITTGKHWGNDPDYQQMSKQLKSISDAYNAIGDTLPEVVVAGGSDKAPPRKNRAH